MIEEYTHAIIYCRVSSERQVNEGHGLDSQEHRCRQYANSLKLDVEHVFREEGVSGGLFERPAMKSLIRYLDKHWQRKYVVIFDDLKRFARDVEVHLKLKSELMGRQAKLRCLNYNFDDSAEGEFVETIFAAQNELERKQNQRQVCQKMKARTERGYWCFNPPAGYTYMKDKEHGKLLVPNKAITDIIANGLTGFAEDRLLTQKDLQTYFRDKGLHRLLGREPEKLTLKYVKDLITQPLYAGFVAHKAWGIPRRPGKHQAIISAETFEKIQQKLWRPERRPRDTDRLEFPLRRIVNCGVCRMKMTGSTTKGRSRYYAHYTCNNSSCLANPKNISVKELEDAYIALLERIKVDAPILEVGRVLIKRMWDEKVKDVEAALSEQGEEKEKIERMIEEYVDRVPGATPALKTRYEAKIESLEQQLNDLSTERTPDKIPNMGEAIDHTLRFLGTPAETWLASDRNTKITLHSMIFAENPSYSVKDGFGTVKVSLPFLLTDQICVPEGTMVDQRGVEPLTSAMRMLRSTN